MERRIEAMIGTKMQEALNEQIKHELESGYLYLSVAGYFHSQGLDGMAGWMRVQAHEEFVHAMKFFDHIKERGGRIELAVLAKPKNEWASPLAAFQDAYRHEQFITSKITALIELAAKETDFAVRPLLHWFVEEQIEEEASTSQVVQMLERIGSSGSGLVMLDRELGKRTAE
jgi:ferritin